MTGVRVPKLVTAAAISFTAGVIVANTMGDLLITLVFDREAAVVTTADLRFDESQLNTIGGGGFLKGTVLSLRKDFTLFNMLVEVPLTGTGPGQYCGLPLRPR